VVAGEVKSLAGQTATATESIVARINEIQQVSAKSVDEVRAVVGMVDRMRELSTETAAAAQQQASATTGISNDVAKASEGVNAAARGAEAVYERTRSTGDMSDRVAQKAMSVREQSTRLRGASERFFDALKSA
jgi:methyl-accepting chemotaxis protein